MPATYRNGVMATPEELGGRFIVRGGWLAVIEGEWPHPRLVAIERPSKKAADGRYHFQKLLPLRLKNSVGSFVIVDGPA